MRMLKHIFLGSIFLAAVAQADTEADLKAEAMALVPPFQQQLLTTVQQAMKAGGPMKALEVCQLAAPVIASEHSKAPWQVGRTALKIRNPVNKPDRWERHVLKTFAKRHKAGEPLQGMNQSAIVKGEFRYMQAIPTGEPCLACHGKNIAPDVVSEIKRRYPADQARGFELGQLRGAFTLRQTLATQDGER